MRRATPLLVLLCAAACASGGAGASADSGDTASFADRGAEADTGAMRSTYALTITFAVGDPVILERDITGLDLFVAFGSTHFPPPTRSFAVTDTDGEGRVETVIFNFGVVRAGPEHPVDVGAPGSFAFSARPPWLTLVIDGFEYRSTDPAAQGSVKVTSFGEDPGEVIAGTVSGTLVRALVGETVQVEGRFHFVLPEPQ